VQAGCVERAIVSTGGAMLSCVGQGVEFKKRMRKRAASTEGPIMPTITNTPTYIYSTTKYVPMSCDGNNTVILALMFNISNAETPTKIEEGSSRICALSDYVHCCEVMNDCHFQFFYQVIKSCLLVSYSFPLKEFEIHTVNAKIR
jgi:hypothetical protein